MSESLALSNQLILRATGGDMEVPRYIDMLKPAPKKPEETGEQIISRIRDGLRRK